MNNSREKILQSIKASQPPLTGLTEVPVFSARFDNLAAKFSEVLRSIGGTAYVVGIEEEIIQKMKLDFPGAKRIISSNPAFAGMSEKIVVGADPHSYEDVDIFIMQPTLAVAENGAVWISDNEIPHRILPFITTNLVAIINKDDIVATMHDAYNKIGDTGYGFATFIAGPSKTADIEQALVLGAHGPLTMTVFILE